MNTEYTSPKFSISSRFENEVLHEGCVIHIDGLDVVISRDDLRNLGALCTKAAYLLNDGFILDNFSQNIND